MRSARVALLSASIVVGASVAAQASAIYDWVCDDASCNGDPTFSAFLELSDAAVAAGDFIGVAGNILSAGITSGVGDGFSLELSDILTGSPGSNTDDVNNVRIVLNALRTEVDDLIDISAGTNITFFDAAEGRVDFLEGTNGNYIVQLAQDLVPEPVPVTGIPGRFVRRGAAAIPEPHAAVLFGLGTLIVSRARRRFSRRPTA